MDHFRDLLVSIIDPENHLNDMSEKDKREMLRQAETAGFEKLQVLLNFLINREENVRFTSNPRLILEATIVKLCRMDDYLSFEELIKKVESLEKRMTSLPGMSEKPPADQLLDPAATWTSQDPGKTREEKRAHTGGDRTWDGFLRFLSSKNRAMSSMLKDWELIELNDDVVKISKDRRSFSSTYFDDQERYQQLSRYCLEFFGRDIQIEIVGNDENAPGEDVLSKKGRPVAVNEPEFDRPVQEIMNIFEGKIREETPDGTTKRKVPRGAINNEEVQE